MPGAGSLRAAASQQGIVVSPAALALEESSSRGQQLRVLSAPPAAGQQLIVAVSVRQQPGEPVAGTGNAAVAAEAAAGGAAVACITVSPASLRFDISSWAEEQEVLVMTGDDQQAQLPAPFDVILSLSSSGGNGSSGSSGSRGGSRGGRGGRNGGDGSGDGDGVSQQLVVPGRRMDDDLRTGGCWPASAAAACCCLRGWPQCLQHPALPAHHLHIMCR
jgi:hypothetical protein